MTNFRTGDELDPLVIAAVDPGKMKTMAVLLRDPNPIHWDPTITSRLGLGERPINQGPINAGYLVEMVLRNLGGDVAALKRFCVRFTGNVLSGQRVECTGRVLEIDESAGTADLELRAHADGNLVLAGTAVVRVVDRS